MKDQTEQTPQPTRSIKQFNVLIGEWDMVGTHPLFPAAVRGHSSFEWLRKDGLLVWHFNWEPDSPPNAISVIGHDDTVDTCTMLYSDDRGVARIYQMSLEDAVWKMWRDSPDFSQRMTSTFSDDKNTIITHGELSRDGQNWEEDLSVTYTRVI